jgi:hypothetical protein
MGVNCCSHHKEAPEIVIQKPERNINIDNKNPKNSQVQNDFIVVNSTQNSQTLRSSSPEYVQNNMYQTYQNTQSMSPQSNINYQNVEFQYSPQVNQSTGGIIPINESNNIVYESQNLNPNNINIQTQSIVSQNENIITNNQSSIVIPQQIINSTQGVLDSNQNQYNPQVGSQVVTMSQNISNQYVNEPFKLDLYTNDNAYTNTNNNPLGFNKNEIDNIFNSASQGLGFTGNGAPSNSQNINNQQINYINQNQQSDTNVNFDELLKQQIGQQQSGNGGNGLNIDELLKQQNNQQQSGTSDTNININDLLNSQNNQQTGMGVNIDELLKQQNNQINDLFFENQNGLKSVSKSMQLTSPNSFQNHINIQKDPLLYSLSPPKPVNISTSIQLDQYSQNNSQIQNIISEPLSPSNQYNNIQQIM